jgi:hypothetical protein
MSGGPGSSSRPRSVSVRDGMTVSAPVRPFGERRRATEARRQYVITLSTLTGKRRSLPFRNDSSITNANATT